MAVIKGLNRRLLLIVILGGLVAIFFIFIKEPSISEKEMNGNSFLEKVMIASGGKNAYESINKFSFIKDFKLYSEDGTIEIGRKELHSYNFKTGTERLIQWKEDNTTYNLVEKDATLFQTRNTSRDTTATMTQLRNKLNAATFVIGLPYTLDNEGSLKRYNGVTDFEGNKAHELEVTFQDSEDVWKMYYERDTMEWLGYWVQTSDHYSLVINETMTMIKGFKFPRKRKSYRTDAQKNRLYLRADYEYSGYYVD